VKGLSVIHYLIMFPMIQRQRCHALPHRCRLANRNHHLATNSTRELRSSAHFLNLFCHHESSTIGLSSWLLEFILSIIWPVKRLIWNELIFSWRKIGVAKLSWKNQRMTKGSENAWGGGGATGSQHIFNRLRYPASRKIQFKRWTAFRICTNNLELSKNMWWS
jgi:hypothetical protein